MQKGDIAKIVISVLLFIFLAFVSVQIYIYHAKAKEAQASYDAAKTQHDSVAVEHVKLEDELKYYLNPLNLEKELRARFNYHAPGEKTLILVPQGAHSSD
jgi:flagellar basal body-associated protein FliL